MWETLKFPVAGVNDLPRDQHDDVETEEDAEHCVHLPVGEALDERQAESTQWNTAVDGGNLQTLWSGH